jgi:EAL domain-containing protein (putative c-di-GMP-specific phosphodiesterase class I)
VLEGVPIDLEACAGAALYPEHGTTVEALLRHADEAMYRGKRGAARVVVHPAGAPEHRAPGLLLQGELRRALDGDELTLHYQPQVKLATGRRPGVEALLRWKHPDRGLLAPGAFLPAVEGSGLIEPLTDWVLRRALSDRAQWLAAGADWNVSVNVSARNLEAPDFAERVIALLAATGTPASGLWIEVTETALAADTDRAARTLEALAAAGVGISIDDFGSGYTSLGLLRTLPVGEVKIDRAFVLGLAECEQDRSIVRSIVDLGHGLGCAVTAEGVEDAETADWLRSAGCDYAQGYHFARPAPWGELLTVEAAA